MDLSYVLLFISIIIFLITPLLTKNLERRKATNIQVTVSTIIGITLIVVWLVTK
ncbi:hypothetical protein [Gracilibacillus oryzae]|uniref:hypothetical protein n=1 Tax=Gracilibacillus oryzae TaxID=1672701 RepID=UPI001295D2CB|nr:hypothetical protein [Gracilibacillus oryzae]